MALLCLLSQNSFLNGVFVSPIGVITCSTTHLMGTPLNCGTIMFFTYNFKNLLEVCVNIRVCLHDTIYSCRIPN